MIVVIETSIFIRFYILFVILTNFLNLFEFKMNDMNLKIIFAIVSLLIAIIGVSWVTIKIKKSKNTNIKQTKINISGENNKNIGKDDNSVNK